MVKTTQVELTEEDAKLFLIFRRHQNNFVKMIQMGVFDDGIIQATLYFDKFSSIRAVDKTKRVLCNNKTSLNVAQFLY